MTVDENKAPIIDIIFIYEKDGVKKEFTEDNYPWQDSTWTFVDTKEKIIRKGEAPAITDFSVKQPIFKKTETKNIYKYEIHEDILQEESYSFLIITPYLTKIKDTEKEKFNAIADFAMNNNAKVYLLTSATTQNILNEKPNYRENVQFCSVDNKVLITIIRSTPGVLLLKDGNVMNKWNKIGIPSMNDINGDIKRLVSTETTSGHNLMMLIYVSLLLILPLIALKWLDKEKSINN